MKRNKFLQKLSVILAIMFVLFQSFLVPLASASWTGTPWKGEAWKGDAWTGDAWNTEGFSWEGEAWGPGKGWIQDGWEQDGWTQEGYTQDGWTGEGINGINPATGQPWTGDKVDGINPATGQPWTGDSIDGINPATGQPWTGDGVNGINPAAGQPWTGNGINGINPATGQPWLGNGNTGINPATGQPWAVNGNNEVNPATGQPWIQNGFEGNGMAGTASGTLQTAENGVNGVTGYGIAKYIFNDVIGGQVKFVKAMEDGKFSLMKPNSLYMLAMNGFKLGLGDSSAGFNTAYDLYNVADKAYSVNNAIDTLKTYSSIPNPQINSYGTLRSALSNAPVANAASAPLGMLAKINLGAAGIGTIFSAIDTVKNTGKAIDVFKAGSSATEKTTATASATESFGTLLMSSGAVASAIPGAQAVGAAMVIGGAALWGTSKLVKFGAKNWGSIKSKAKGLWNSVTGAFS